MDETFSEGNSGRFPDKSVLGRSAAADPIARGLSLKDFWQRRNSGDPVWLDRWTINNVSCLFAYFSHVSGITPNQLSILSGIFSLVAFVAALVLPSQDLVSAVIVIYLAAQVSYLFDCADGQLARTANQETEFGAFLDKGIDIVSNALSFGGVFLFLYRYYSNQDESALAELAIAVGFVFLHARSARFFAWQTFVHMFRAKEPKDRVRRGVAARLLVSFMDHQASLFGVFLFLISPWLGFSLFAVQAVIMMVVYFRYFRRAYTLDKM